MFAAAKVNALRRCVCNNSGVQRYKPKMVSGVFITSSERRNNEKQG